MVMDKIFEQSDYWFLESFKLEGNQITVIINEGIVSSRSEDVGITGSKKVNITFYHVLAHQVIDESYSVPEDGKIEGKILCLHQKSAYLKYLIDNSLVSQLIDDVILHYSLNLGDDVIHVITTEQPEVNLIS